jgi:hypothetical protein
MLMDHLKYNQKTLVIDSDMFLVNDLNVEEKYNEYQLAVVPQFRNNNTLAIDIPYVWNGLIYYDMPNVKNKHLLNWNTLGPIEHGLTDVGGNFYYYLKHTPDAKIYNIQHLWSCTWNKSKFPQTLNNNLLNFLENDPKNVDNKYYSEIYDELYLHYRAGGNWINEGKDIHEKRTNLLWDTIVSILK